MGRTCPTIEQIGTGTSRSHPNSNHQAGRRVGHFEIGPEMTRVAVKRLRLAAGTIGVTAVEPVEEAVAEDGLTHLDREGIGDDVVEDEGRKGWRSQHQMAGQAAGSAPLLGVVQQLRVPVHLLAQLVKVVVGDDVVDYDVAVRANRGRRLFEMRRG